MCGYSTSREFRLLIECLRCDSTTMKRPRRLIWRYKLADFDRANVLLADLDLDSILESGNMNLCWLRWKNAFMKIMRICVPSATLPDISRPPWLTKVILQAIRKRNLFFKRAKGFRQGYYFRRYKIWRSKVTNLLRTSKRAFFRKIDPRSPREFWKMVKRVSLKKSSIPTLVSGTLVVSDDVGKANMLNSHFTSNFNTAFPPLQCSHMTLPEHIPDDLLCTEEEVLGALSSLDTSKASGPDGLSPTMLKATAAGIAPALTRLFNMSLLTGCLPADWKVAWVTPVPKSAKKSDPSQYRPISLLSVASKVLEKHVKDLIMVNLAENSVITPFQWGFLEGRSTTGALLEAVDRWHRFLERKSEVCVVFLDLSKAFDRVPHAPLLDKLRDLDLDPYLVRWLGNYLQDRRQNVVVGGILSVQSLVLSGVPQGSVLGPLLFLLYINDVASVVTCGNFMSLFADDIVLFRELSSLLDCVQVQLLLDNVSSWFANNHMSFNVSKCKYMVISRRRAHQLTLSTLSLNGVDLERVSVFKYLGVWLSSDLSWTHHVDQITLRASKHLGIVYRTFYSHASSAVFLQLYISFVRPFLEYAAPVWDPHHSTLIDKIEKVQRFALRMASKQWNSDYATLLAWSGLPTLQSRRRVLSLCFFAQSIHGVVHSTLPSLQLRSMDSRLRSFDVCTFEIPFASSLSYQSSFFPRAVKLWNQLPIETKLCQSFLTFKHHLHCIFF